MIVLNKSTPALKFLASYVKVFFFFNVVNFLQNSNINIPLRTYQEIFDVRDGTLRPLELLSSVRRGIKSLANRFENMKIKVDFADDVIISSDNLSDKLLDCV